MWPVCWSEVPGYYLIKDSKHCTPDKGEAFTAYVHRQGCGQCGSQLVKVDYPTVEKKVKENSNKFRH